MERIHTERLSNYALHESQRGYFGRALYEEMANNPDIWLISVDLGYGLFDAHFSDFPERAINVGASEQAALGVSVGLALEGKIPCVYSITPFLLYRPFETIRNYIDHEQIPVKLFGGGRGQDYAHDGFSHHAEEDKQILAVLSGIDAHWPETKDEIPDLLHDTLTNGKPTYVNLRR